MYNTWSYLNVFEYLVKISRYIKVSGASGRSAMTSVMSEKQTTRRRLRAVSHIVSYLNTTLRLRQFSLQLHRPHFHHSLSMLGVQQLVDFVRMGHGVCHRRRKFLREITWDGLYFGIGGGYRKKLVPEVVEHPRQIGFAMRKSKHYFCMTLFWWTSWGRSSK